MLSTGEVLYVLENIKIYIILCFFCALCQSQKAKSLSLSLKTPPWQADHIQEDMKRQTDVCDAKTC